MVPCEGNDMAWNTIHTNHNLKSTSTKILSLLYLAYLTNDCITSMSNVLELLAFCTRKSISHNTYFKNNPPENRCELDSCCDLTFPLCNTVVTLALTQCWFPLLAKVTCNQLPPTSENIQNTCPSMLSVLQCQTLALHASLSSGSTPASPHLLTSVFTYSDHVFVRVPNLTNLYD